MKRWVAAFLLVLFAAYLGASSQDRCVDSDPECVQVCHILCQDGCANAPLPEPPTPPPADPLPSPRFAAARAKHLLSLEPEPEKEPPRR